LGIFEKQKKDVIAGPDRNDSTTIKSKYSPVSIEAAFKPDKLRVGIPKVNSAKL
jgi:hypothetical protein